MGYRKYQGEFPRYDETAFRGHEKNKVLGAAVTSLLDNMEAAGIDFNRVLHEVQLQINERQGE